MNPLLSGLLSNRNRSDFEVDEEPFHSHEKDDRKNYQISTYKRRSRAQWESSVSSKSSDNVNEEYKEAFRTTSYVDMLSKVQRQLGRTSLEKFSSSASSSSSSPSLHHLSDFLLEPKQETLINMMESFKIHQHLVDYFRASFEACNSCELLLQSLHQTRANYRKIKRVIKISESGRGFWDSTDDDQRGIRVIFKELSGFVLLKNPLSIISPMRFGEIHDNNMELRHKLTSKQKKIKKISKLKRLSKKVGRHSLVISHGALVVVLLVLAFHGMIGLVVAPGLITGFLGFTKKKIRSGTRRVESRLERLGVQLDIAAKGIFILINDFDTMSRLVCRLYDEIEHLKTIANMCVRNGKSDVLKEAVKEFQMHESVFLEQLEELEQHIYLCFHTINRSRRLVIEKILDTQPETKA